MNTLSDDLIKKICEYLDTKSMVIFLSSSRYLNSITNIDVKSLVNINNKNFNKNFNNKFNFLKVLSDSNSIKLLKKETKYLQITSLNNSFSLNNLTNLTKLICSNIRLLKFPEITSLKNLKHLDLSFNNITIIPENLPNNIEVIYLEHNQIDFIPTLPNLLQLINLSSNNITMIPLNSFPEGIKHIYLNRNYNLDSEIIFSLREKYKKTFISY